MLGSCGVLRAPLRTFHFVVATFPCRVGRGEGVGFPERVWPFLLSALFHGVSPEFRVLEFVCSPEGGNGFYLRVCESITFSMVFCFSISRLPFKTSFRKERETTSILSSVCQGLLAYELSNLEIVLS